MPLWGRVPAEARYAAAGPGKLLSQLYSVQEGSRSTHPICPPLSAAAARASFGIRFRRGQGRRIALRPAQTLKGSLQVELHAHFEHAERRAEAGVSPLSAQRWASASWPISSSVRAEETCASESVCAENALHALFGITRSRFCY